MKKEKDLFFMKKALKQASIAFKNGEVPVGAIVVDSDGNILSRGYNQIEKKGCQCAHAEIIAIQKACKKVGTWRLDGCCIYVTLEPCLMCLGLIQLSRIRTLYFGAICKEFGSGLKLAKKHKLYKKRLGIVGGLQEKESIDILKQFFVKLRKKRKVYCEAKDSVSGESKTQIT